MKYWDSGRLIAYLGGSSVGVGSVAQKAQAADITKAADTISLLNYPLPIPHIDITLADVTTIGGFLIVLSRFVWDIRRSRRVQQQQEQNNE